MRRTGALVSATLLLVATLLAACATPDVAVPPDSNPTTTTTLPPETTPTTVGDVPPEASPVIVWGDSTVVASFQGGWTVTACEGDAPLLCVSRDGEVVGLVEMLIHDPMTYDAFDPGDTVDANLARIAQTFVTAMIEDRAAGCPEGYTVTPFETTDAVVGGTPGVSYGYRGTLADGTPSELNVQHSTLSGGRLLTFTATAYDEGGCPGRDEMASFTTTDLEAFRPHLEQMLALSALPDSLPDGYVFAWIVGDSVDGLRFDPATVLTGEAAVEAAVADGVIAEGEDLPNDFYITNPDPTVFVPRFAPDARWTILAPDADGQLVATPVDVEIIRSIMAGTFAGDVYGVGPEFLPFDLLVVGGVVIEANQRYLP